MPESAEWSTQSGIQFTTANGRELHAWLTGRPGARTVSFELRHRGMTVPYGEVSLRRLIDSKERAKDGKRLPIHPNGQPSKRRGHTIVLSIQLVNSIAEWAQEEVLGRAEVARRERA